MSRRAAPMMAAVSFIALLGVTQAHAALTDYASGICGIESNCNNSATNPDSTATGRYQFTQAALVDAGWFEKESGVTSDDFGEGEWSNGSWKENPYGISSRQEFMENQEAQDHLMEQYTKNNWNTLERLGTTDYAGAEWNGVILDDAALLAGSHLLGPAGLDEYLRNGTVNGEALANHPDMERLLHERMSQFSGQDVSELTGREFVAGANADELFGGADPSGIEGVACDPAIAAALAESAAQHVEARVAMALDESLGYSRTEEPFGLLSCLENLMSGDMDVLFEPPGLGDILGMLEDFVCQKAEEMYAQVEGSVNDQLSHLSASTEGFAPVEGMGDFVTGGRAGVKFDRRKGSPILTSSNTAGGDSWSAGKAEIREAVRNYREERAREREQRIRETIEWNE